MPNYLILKSKTAVLVKPRDPNKVLEVIPTAKVVNVKGERLVAVPHKPDETVVLRNIGYDVPSPMNIYYPYNAVFTPFDAQKETAQFASMNRRCFILNSMGLGKTITSLWTIDYLKKVGLVHKVLVVCPISVMERTWYDEIYKSFPDMRVRVLYGNREKRLKLLAEEADIYIINTDAIGIIKEDMAFREDIDLIVIDECALFRNSQSQRWKYLNEVCNKQVNGARRVWGLTGSPIPNEPTDAFGQIKLVTPMNPDCPKYFGRFRDLTMTQLTQFKWVQKPTAVDTVYKMMQPAIRYTLEDVVDLPPQIVVQREVKPSPEQSRAYKDMFVKLCAEIEASGSSITAVNEAVKANKLLQICCGVAYDDAHGEVALNCASRLETTEEAVDESEGKSIVFVPFKGALEVVRAYLAEKHEVAVVDGDTPKSDRDNIFHRFQDRDDPLQVIVANPGTMSHGITLTAATTIVWYGPCYSNETFQQANARIYRTGQTRSTVIVQLVSTNLEAKVYERLANKQGTQGLLLDMVKSNKLNT